MLLELVIRFETPTSPVCRRPSDQGGKVPESCPNRRLPGGLAQILGRAKSIHNRHPRSGGTAKRLPLMPQLHPEYLSSTPLCACRNLRDVRVSTARGC